MNHHITLAVLVPEELLNAFDSKYEKEFFAVLEHGRIILRPRIPTNEVFCELAESNYRRGYFAGIKEGYDQGYTDAIECDPPADICCEVNELRACDVHCILCPYYDDLFETCRYYFS